MSQAITIYTDGSCETQTRQGGWAAILTQGERRKVISGKAADATNNMMELRAVIEALNALKQSGSQVALFTDSNYVAKGVNQWLSGWMERGWRNTNKQPIANVELWQQLQVLLTQHQVQVRWIPREQNAEADAIAQAARTDEAASDQPSATEYVLIAGSRSASRPMLNYARRLVQRAKQCGYSVLVGDNPRGVDNAAVQECRRLRVPVVVCGIANYPRNGGCKHGEYIKVARDTYRAANGHLLDGYTVRDRYMVDLCQRAVFVWDGASPGTKAGYDYAVQRGKDAHLKTFEQTGAR